MPSRLVAAALVPFAAQGFVVQEAGELEPALPSPAGEALGAAVAIDGDTAIVGAPDRWPEGIVRIYVSSSGTWTAQAELEPDAGAPYSNQADFGASVAVSGDTVAVGAPDDSAFGATSGSVLVFVRTGTTWTEQARFTGSKSAGGADFGRSVTLAGDRLLVGATYDAQTGPGATGGAYVFERTGSVWTEQAALFPIDGMAGDRFGASAALWGDTALIGSPRDDLAGVTDAGSAYLFVRSGAVWSQQAKLSASDKMAQDLAGTSVALEGDEALVGSPYRDLGATVDAGAVYVFARSGTDWSETDTLTASDAAAGDRFGSSISCHGDTFITGAPLDDNPGGTDAGSTYVFTRAGTTWTEQGILTSSDGGFGIEFGGAVALFRGECVVGAVGFGLPGIPALGRTYFFQGSGSSWVEEAALSSPPAGEREHYGAAVALSEGRALVGDPWEDNAHGEDAGGAYVMRRQGAEWTEEAWLVSGDGEASDYFGHSAALHGDIAVLGAPNADGSMAPNTGSAYVFVDAGGWGFQARLQSIALQPELFGYAVAVDGDTIVVGAPEAYPGGLPGAGAAHVFSRSGTSWSETAELTASDGDASDSFGSAVAISGNTIAVGAASADGLAPVTGAAYVFVYGGGSWTEQAKLSGEPGPSTHPFAQYGTAIDIDGDRVLVGAYSSNVNGVRQGAAYVFDRAGTTWGPPYRITAALGELDDRFGFSVSVSGDLAVVGAPRDDIPTTVLWNEGSAYAFLRVGAAWVQRAEFRGADVDETDYFGTSVAVEESWVVAGALELYDGPDQGRESSGSGNASGPGSVYSFQSSSITPTPYCSAGISASGCMAQLSSTGAPSASAPSGFLVEALQIEGDRDGMFFFGTNGTQANPWGNGSSYQCVVPPVKRAGLMSGTGTTGACDGALAQDMNSLWSSSPAKNPGAGAVAQLQLWYRDPLSTSNRTTSFSNALEFLLGP